MVGHDWQYLAMADNGGKKAGLSVPKVGFGVPKKNSFVKTLLKYDSTQAASSAMATDNCSFRACADEARFC